MMLRPLRQRGESKIFNIVIRGKFTTFTHSLCVVRYSIEKQPLDVNQRDSLKGKLSN